jgi:elongation of very long chain fatty acids protein 6
MSNSVNIEEIIAKRPFGWTFTEHNKTFSFAFEEGDIVQWHNQISSNWEFAGYAGVTYILAIFGLQWWMRDRKAFQLKWPLFWWNLGLGIFSIFGFARTLPGFLGVLFGEENGFYHSICTKRNMNVATVFWTCLFAWSKFVELGDTLFIVLRKRPLIFLQWYHHVVTMSVTWILAPLVEPIGRWYTVLNYGVHSLMYPYFALRAVGIKIPSRIANLITTLQFAQMIIGFTVNMLSLLFQRLGYECVRYPISIQLFGLVYGSFLLLFGNLFYDSVIKKGRMKRDGLVEKKIH